jgi:hypothetical protein
MHFDPRSASVEKKADEIEKFLLANGSKPMKDVGGIGIIGVIPPRGDASPQRHYSRPPNRSFEAYCDFILGMTAALGVENDLTEEKLREGWRQFWQAADEGAKP